MGLGISVTESTTRLRARLALSGALLFLAAAGAAAQSMPVLPTQAPLSTQLPTQGVPATPTAEQLRMLQTLPDAQRQELMRALGIPDYGTQLPAGTVQRAQMPMQLNLPAQPTEEPTGPPVLEAGSTVVVKLTLPQLSPDAADAIRRRSQEPLPAVRTGSAGDDEQQDLQELARLGSGPNADPAVEKIFLQRVERNPQLGRLLGASTYVIDRAGLVNFPGVASVRLAGLTEYQAARRLEAEPTLRPLKAEVLLMPVQAFGVDSLEPFGYDFFSDATTFFAPGADVPVPPDYMIGPGDEVRVQLFGKENAVYTLPVSRDGTITFPQIGPVAVAGMSFENLRDLIQERVSEQMIGVAASVTLGQLRWVRVFVLGDVVRPGSYTMSGLSTMTNALFMSGGVGESGSLRAVQLRRGGRTVQTLDVYDLLLHGNSSRDARVQSNDVIFIPPRGPTVAVAGEVQRPAIYELAGERTLEQAIALAGGLTATAFASSARVESVDRSGGRSVHSYDLETAAGANATVRNGDRVTIDALPDDVLTDHVTLAGHVLRPGPFEWRAGMRLTDLIGSVNDLKPDADRGYVLVTRQLDRTGPIEVFSADLGAALLQPGGPNDPMLRNLDEVTVFDRGAGRISVVAPLLRQLRQQAEYGRPAREVEVTGMVHAPGTYPLEEGMRVSDLLRAGGNLTDSAFGLTAEVARYGIEGSARRVVDMQQVDLAAVLAGDPAADITLEPFDQLNVRQVSQWMRKGSVLLEGEVKFPGRYAIEPGETLSSVIERAGGLSGFAFPEGSVFLRDDLREREREQIDRLITRLESDLAVMTLQAAQAAAVQGVRGPDQSIAVGQSILGQLRRAEPLGRLVIDLPGLLAGDKSLDVMLRDGDRLHVPEVKQEVMVLGEVQYATSHLYREGLGRDDYVAASGGTTVNADDDRTYVVRANGAVVGGSGSKWFGRDGGMAMRPGDAVIVPLAIDRVPALALWQSSTSIIYNLAVAVAALGGL